jgi:hypothetical protein
MSTDKAAHRIRYFAILAIVSMTAAVYAAVSDWQRGSILRLTNESEAEVRASLEQLAQIGVNFVAVTPGWLTDTETSSNVERKYRTPSDEIFVYMIE